MHDDLSAQPGPIQEKYRLLMNALAHVLDEVLNGSARTLEIANS